MMLVSRAKCVCINPSLARGSQAEPHVPKCERGRRNVVDSDDAVCSGPAEGGEQSIEEIRRKFGGSSRDVGVVRRDLNR